MRSKRLKRMHFANEYRCDSDQELLNAKHSDYESISENSRSIRLLLFLQCKKARKEIIDCLVSNHEFTFDVSTSLSKCLTVKREDKYDALITDYCDFNVDLTETVSNFKDSLDGSAIILLKTQTNPLDEIECLNAGIDNVVSFPFKAPLLLARIKALMRWKNLKAQSSFQIGPFKLNLETRCLSTKHFGDVRITNKESLILQFLLSQKGKTVSRTDLLRHVWGYNSSANTHTVETHIYRLRKKIGTVVDSKTVIVTEVGGYRLAK